ncbi:MAG: hypothetical protein J0L92_21580 [Deltaproteobacteria bacterium]|nr:hypothetical protein [Deltaproteobacteria bacterium]
MTIDAHAATLLARLDKEIARAEAGTVAVGGITKVGQDLEALLKVCASTFCRSQGRSLDDELRRLGATRGPGSYAKVLQEVRRGAGHPVSEAIAADLRMPKSRIRALIEVRNANSHVGADPASQKAVLRGAATLLRPFVATSA